MKTTRVFLSVTAVAPRKPAGANPFTYRDTRPLRHRASWWTRGTSTEMYRSKIVATREEAVSLAQKFLDNQNKDGVRWIDTTDQPERYGYSHEPATPITHAAKKSARQLDAEVADADLAAMLARNPGATEAGVRSYLRGSYGDSGALTRATTAGSVVVVGHKIYRKEDLP